METNIMKKIIQVKGMSCSSCELKIEKTLNKIDGVFEVKAIYSSSNVYVTYDASQVSIDALMEQIEGIGYEVEKRITSKNIVEATNSGKVRNKLDVTSKAIGVLIIFLSLHVILDNALGINVLGYIKDIMSLKYLPELDSKASMGILFLVGLLTSFHCVGMCGGITLSQCVGKNNLNSNEGSGKKNNLKPALLYNSGRVISYTVIGGIAGGIGAAVSFSGAAKGIVAIIGGLFMIIMGINMLGMFPGLRKMNLRLPKAVGRMVFSSEGKYRPFYIGILNGLMPCGPLQMMQLYALGTGSMAIGAASMFVFSLGTVPLLLGFGAISSLLNAKYTHRMMKISAALVIVLGLMMMGRGFSLSGITMASANPLSKEESAVAKLDGNVQTVISTVKSGSYQPILVQKGVPVRWVIRAEKQDLNGCNNAISIPKYGIEQRLIPGDNIIEFTPVDEGNINFSCWMGMINSNIKVVSDISKISEEDMKYLNDNGLTGSGSCCSDASKAVKFQNGKIPTDNILVPKVVDNKQEVTIKVNDEGYSPAVIVLQKGAQVRIKFDTVKLNKCNYVVVFPEYRGQLNLQEGETETPYLNVQQNFTFQCGMNMLHGYVKVVDDINKVDLNAVEKEVETYKPISNGAGIGGCCG